MKVKKQYDGAKKKTTVCLSVFLAITLLLGGTLLAFAENSDGAVPLSQHYVSIRQDVSCQAVDYLVDRVVVERRRVEKPEEEGPLMHTVRFFLGEGSDRVFVGSVKVVHEDCIPPYESIRGVATVTSLLVSPEEFHGWYYYDTEGERVYVPEPADVTVLSDMDLFADLDPRLPRAIEFVFYGHLGRADTVSVNGKPEQRWLPDPAEPTLRVYDVVIDGVRSSNITWMFVEERYNRLQISDMRLGGPPWVDWPSAATLRGLKPTFFTYPKRMWEVYEDTIEAEGKFVADRGYNDFVYRPVPVTSPNPPYSTFPAVTYYMDYAIANSMEFVKKTVNNGGTGVEYLVATFHVYPTYPTDHEPYYAEGGIQGEDEE